ncbi:transforming growth factor beta receptor type 3 isoform X2 [Tachysurus vachellii]|uniref:transforming growth factor beta receptor type 3 isoform X2 n=1 Tax=Tachysurus vachellii TaxID=175792 RepID=UPI00296B19A1|nr:transforming growth factor beta receptor type 3 isoform X2 [Tachysurus vachellii]XP_060720814.1 transforming growth factor beta receptor type 3 isoform X2 [Tachysurus vachellii]
MMLQSGWALICLLLFMAGTAGEVMLQCSVSPAGALHPVHAQLERFEAGPGCAAREGGAKETHVISVARPNHSTDKMVTVVLRPLSYSHPVHRPVILVLSSQHAMHWVLESEGLPKNLHVLVQVSENSTLENGRVSARVHSIPSMPWRPRALLRWTLQRHATVSSLTHSASANRVYLRLGEDPSMPSVCRLQSLFLSHNYMVSKLQEQEVNGCASSESLLNPEVHVIKLWSAGSGLCGSLQVEVSVSLLPPVADAGWCNVVLVLSSAAPVNWALVTPGLRGHITVHSSHSVTPLYPPKPDLTMSSTVIPDLITTPDLLTWANQNGFSSLMSYTEAHLANRFVIKLKGGGTVQAVREAKLEESWLRRWMSHEVDDAVDSRKVVSVQCADGRLAVSVDKSSLQALALSVSAVTLKDPLCQARANGSHFLLVFPVISCGTEGEMEQHGREVQYRNTILLWKSKPSLDMLETTREKSANESTPMVIHFSCAAPLPALSSASTPSLSSRPQGMLRSGKGSGSAPGSASDPGPAPGPAPAPVPGSAWFPVPHSGPPLNMQLFATDKFEQKAVGPCVVTVQGRVYAKISGSVGVSERLELRSCVFSPLSDPRAQIGWPIIRNFCPADSSFIMHTETQTERGAGEDEDGDTESNEEEEPDSDDEERAEEHVAEKEQDASEDEERPAPKPSDDEESTGTMRLPSDTRRDRHLRGMRDSVSRGVEKKQSAKKKEKTIQLRFSFILRPVFNNSIQFLHCSLQLCGDATETHRDCTHTPAPTNTPAAQQCEYRNLSRPVLVTYLPDALAGLVPPPADKLAQKPRATETVMSTHSLPNSVVSSVLISVIAAFLMGVVLMGALWCIYSCTGRRAIVRRDSLQEIPSSWSPMSPVEQTTTSSV